MDDNSNEYVKEKVWKDYSKDEYIEGILVDVLNDMGEYKNTLYKIRGDNTFIAVWGSTSMPSIYSSLL